MFEEIICNKTPNTTHEQLTRMTNDRRTHTAGFNLQVCNWLYSSKACSILTDSHTQIVVRVMLH